MGSSLGQGTVESILELNIQVNFWSLVSPLKWYFETIPREGEEGRKPSWLYRQAVGTNAAVRAVCREQAQSSDH